MSQQLNRLEKELATSTDRSQWIELTAKISIALARLGRFTESRQRIDLLRGASSEVQIGRYHVWVMLAEAILTWFESLNSAALDRVTRVQVLSGAMRFAEVYATASAWKAHIQFEISDFDGMFRSLDLAISETSPQNGDANTRIAIILANTYWLCGEIVKGQHWFIRGRKFALDEGDFPSVEALQYNRAVLGVTFLRAEASLNPVQPHRIHLARKELESARNLQSLSRNEVLVNHMQLSEARLLMLENRYNEAKQKLLDARTKAPFAEYHFNQSVVNLEIANCAFSQGEMKEAASLYSTLDFNSYLALDIDEQLVATAIRYRMAGIDAGFGDASEILGQLQLLQRAYLESRAELSKRLELLAAESKLS